MNLLVARAARHVVYFALVALHQRTRWHSESERAGCVQWALDSIAREVDALAAPSDPRVATLWATLRGCVDRFDAAAGDAERRALLQEVASVGRRLVIAASSGSFAANVGAVVAAAWTYAQQLALTLLCGAVVVATLAYNAPVRSVVIGSRVGVTSLAVLSVLAVCLFAWLEPAGRRPFWSPFAVPPPGRTANGWLPRTSERRFLLGLASSLGAALVLLLAAALLLGFMSPEFRSPVTVVAGLGVFFLAAHAVDVWDYFDPRPVRVFGALIAAAIVWVSLGYTPDEPWDVRPLPAAPAHWIRSSQWPREGEGPVVLLALSGGGSRAAIFGSAALATLDREVPDIARNIQAISAVSGGSLATAGYLATRMGRVDARGYDAAMSADFVWPLLRAAFTPELRAQAVVSSWNDLLHVGDVSLDSLAQRWNDRTLPMLPVPILNATDMSGHGVTMSPFEPAAFAADDRAACKEDQRSEAAWVCDRDESHAIQDLLPGVDVPLLSAVRASANFPLAFPLIPVRSPGPIPGHAQIGDPTRTRLTDGGVRINSGVDPLYYLMLSHREAIRRRGAVLVVVDAMAASRSGAVPGEWEILATLRRSSVSNVQRLHRMMVTRLAAEFGGRFGCVRVDAEPSSLSGVPTSWYVDAQERRTVRGHFQSDRWTAQRNSLRWTFDAVGAAAPEADPALVEGCLARPSLQ